MIIEKYKHLMALDALVKKLSMEERALALKKTINKAEGQPLTERMIDMLLLIEKHGWMPPKVKIGQDRLTYYFDAGEWKEIHHYHHQILNDIYKQIK